MRHRVAFSKRAGFDTVLLQDTETGACAEIIPSLGGMVHRIAFNPGREPLELLASDADETLGSMDMFRGRVLFPWNDRIPAGCYSFAGNTYRLPQNDPSTGSSIHGFLYQASMRLLGIMQDAHGARAKLGYRSEPRDGYPFPLTLELDYELERNTFRLTFRIENTGSNPAPLAFGWHPYFRFGASGDTATIRARFTARYEADERALPTGQPVPVLPGDAYDFSSGRSLSGLSLDHAFRAPNDGTIVIAPSGMEILLIQDRQVFGWNQLFIPPDRKSVAVEPVTAAPDSFNHPERGLLVLGPKETVTASISLTLVR